MYILIALVILPIILFNLYLILLNSKISKLEKKIVKSFKERNNLIPSLFEVTKWEISRHDDVFKEIIALRKKSTYNKNDSFIEIINNELKIHNELNFIFKVCMKNLKLEKNEKFLLIRDLFLERSSKIGKNIELYKFIINKFNKLLKFKNITILWIFINIQYRDSI